MEVEAKSDALLELTRFKSNDTVECCEDRQASESIE